MTQEIEKKIKNWVDKHAMLGMAAMLGEKIGVPMPADKEQPIVERVAKTMGYSQPVKAYYTAKDLLYVAAGPDIKEDGTVEWQIRISPALLYIYGEQAFSGIIAHEIAHIINHDTERRMELMRQTEVEADALAKRYGFGPALADALATNLKADDGKNIPASLQTHPPDQERIARLRAA